MAGKLDSLGWTQATEVYDTTKQYPMLRAVVDGETYLIPEMWVVGFCRSGATVPDAARHWHEQALRAERAK